MCVRSPSHPTAPHDHAIQISELGGEVKPALHARQGVLASRSWSNAPALHASHAVELGALYLKTPEKDSMLADTMMISSM